MAIMLPARKIQAALDNKEEPVVSEKVWTLPFTGLTVFLGIYYLSPEDFVPGMEGVPLAKVIAIATCLFAIKENISKGRPWFVPARETKLFLVFCAIMMVGIPFSAWPGGSMELFTTQIVRLMMLILLFGNCLKSPRQIAILMRCIVVFGIVIAAVSFHHYLTGQLDNHGRLIGYGSKEYENPNDLSLGLLTLIPLAAALYVQENQLAIKMLFAMAMGLMAVVILLSLSRTGMIGLAFLVSLALLEMGKRSPAKALVLCLAIVATAVMVKQVSPTIADRADSIFDSEKDESGSKAERLSQMGDGITVALDHPVLGAGLGMSSVTIVAMHDNAANRWVKIHNTYILIAAELGLPGLLVFLLMVMSSIRNLKTISVVGSQGESMNYQEEGLAKGLRKALLVFMVAASFSPVAYNFFLYILIGLSGALLSTVPRLEECRASGVSNQFPSSQPRTPATRIKTPLGNFRY
jgi:O-antigen ligase